MSTSPPKRTGSSTEYTGSAWRWFGLGAVAALVTIVVGLREPLRVMRVAGAIAGADLMTVAILTASGVRLSLIHIVSLQFVAGVGLDYALFFARRQLDDEERARTLRTLITCNAMTVLTFGLLALCRTPLLRQIGINRGDRRAGGARIRVPVRREQRSRATAEFA